LTGKDGEPTPERNMSPDKVDGKMTIEGKITIDGGWIDLPQPITFDFYGFNLEVSEIGFGTENKESCWIKFSGALKLSAEAFDLLRDHRKTVDSIDPRPSV